MPFKLFELFFGSVSVPNACKCALTHCCGRREYVGQTGDPTAESHMILYGDRIEVKIASATGCAVCKMEESYTMLLIDIDYVKTGYIGNPSTFHFGTFLMCVSRPLRGRTSQGASAVSST